MNLKINLANKANYGSARKVTNIKYIVIHYTANDGDTDEANAKYFKSHIVKASAHYFVDDDSVTQSVPDNYVAWSVGGSRYANYKKTGGAAYYGICTNTNSISVELCDCKKNGVYDFTEKTLANAAEAVGALMQMYHIDINHVIRHFDVTGKVCPAPFVNSAAAWTAFKQRLGAVPVVSAPTATVAPTTSTTTTSSSTAVGKNSECPFLIKVLGEPLNIRKAASSTSAIAKKNGAAANTVFTITKVSGSWGYLKSGAGWISISGKYVKRR